MRPTTRLLSSVLIATLLTGSAFAQMNPREFKRMDEGKITKSEAQHLVMQRFPGARVKKAELRRGKDHSVWLLDVLMRGDAKPTRVEVDGRSGKVLSPQVKP